MLGQALSKTQSFPRRWLYRLWGIPDINTRQKWSALWPYLRNLNSPIRLLDAGCGTGSWALELAARNPDWTIVGVDRDSEAICSATRRKDALDLFNVSFLEEDFLTYQPSEPYDVVLSVASAHYLVADGKGEDLFAQFKAWLRPGGALLLLGPRCRDEVPSLGWLPLPTSKLRDVLSLSQIKTLCQSSELNIEHLWPVVFTLGTVSKQLNAVHGLTPFLPSLLYPIEWGLSVLDRYIKLDRSKSAYWVLVAHRS